MANIFSTPFLGGSGGMSAGDAGSIASGAGAAISVGSSIYGAIAGGAASKDYYNASKNIAGLQQQAEAQRYQSMQLQAQRSQMEVLRNNQRARSLALNNATSEGAQFGSGLQGGYGQISGQSTTNSLGINQNLEIGTNLFGINSQISQQEIAKANAQSAQSSAAGIAGIGKAIGGSLGSLTSAATTLAPLLLL